MFLKDLLGKKVIRTAPIAYQMYEPGMYYDRMFMDSPIFIWFATDQYAVYEHVNGFYKDEKRILQKEWLDDKWMDCEWLLKTANDEHLKLMQQEKELETTQEDKDVVISMLDKDDVEYLNFAFDCAREYMKHTENTFKETYNFDVKPVMSWIDAAKVKMLGK